jgi:hypothetical protein
MITIGNRPLRFGTNVIYNEQIGIIKSISKTDNVMIQFFSNNKIENVKKTKLKATTYDKGELIKYEDTYYIITDILLKNKNLYSYELCFVNKIITKFYKIINSNDKNIIGIDKKEQEKITSYLKFIDRYNSTISFLNKRKTIFFIKLETKTADKDMEHLFKRCKLSMSQLNKIENTLKKFQQINLQIQNIYSNPFDFITQDYQLIKYDKAEKICDEYNLDINFKIKLEKWSYDLFLREKNAIYIPKWIYNCEMKKFCDKRNQNSDIFLDFINKIIVDKIIGKNKFGKDMLYKTTEYLLNFEKKTTDLMIDLYYTKDYDIQIDIIKEKINVYETKKRIEENKPTFYLENEQKKSVINSIKNKLSIITGPPGTGKTEILKCINFVLCELHKEENTYLNSSDINQDDYDIPINEDETESFYNGYESDCETSNKIYDEELNKFINPKTIGLLAPTGLAYVNMQRSQKSDHYNINISGTCHRTLYHTIPNIKKHKTKCVCEKKCLYKLNINLFEIDEASMLDIFVFYDILKACKYFNARLILLGDVDQLQSIGPGKILYQLIKSEMFSVTELITIKRQKSGALVNNILKMRKEIITKNDFVDNSMVLIDVEKFITINKEINKEEIINFINDNNLNKNTTKFIASFNLTKFVFNTKNLNIILQNIFNPLIEGFENDEIHSNYKYENSFSFRVNDKIIRTENDYSSDKMRANGEEATIINFDGKNIQIKYSGPDDKLEKIGINELYESFMLNYCVTVHKSQGSQYKNVVFLIEPNNSIIDKKTIYTAISRAQERCFVISKETDFIKLQNENIKVNYKVSLFMEDSDNYDFV